MAKGTGATQSCGICKEAVRGTVETTPTYWIPFSEVDIQEKDKRVVEDQARGIIEDATGASIVAQWAEAKLKAPIGDKHFPLILLAALGTLATTDDADTDVTIKDHTITVAQNSQHQSLSLFIDDPLAAADYKHALGVLSSLEINYEQNKFLEYAVDFKAKKGATATLTPSITSENKFLPQHLVFKLASAYSGLTAASAIAIKSLKLKIEKNLEEDFVLGSVAPVDFLNKNISIEGDCELLWTDETYKTLTLAGTSQAMRIDLISDVTIGTAAHPEVQINLGKILFEEIAVSRDIKGIVKQALKFKAYYSVTDSLMISCKVVNAVASY